jgi:hypothetical protein
MLALMRNLFPIVPPSSDVYRSTSSCPKLPAGRMSRSAGDPLLGVRWELVRALRTAIASGRYDVEARLDDLLDDPPAELIALGWS